MAKKKTRKSSGSSKKTKGVVLIDKRIRALEKEVMKKKQELARIRKRKPLQEVADVVFTGVRGENITLSQLFGDRDELILIHNMGARCNYCSLWADGISGLMPQLSTRVAVVLESYDPLDTLRDMMRRRKWKMPAVSSHGSSFREDMGYAKKGEPWPGVSTFMRKNGKIYRFADTFFGPGDNYCSVWDFLDLLPKGSKGWDPLPNSWEA